MISTCDRHPRGRGSGNRGGDGPLGSGSQQGEESKSTATHGRCERGWSNDVHQLKDHGRIRSKRRSADQLEHRDGVVAVESNESKSKKGEAGERAFSVRSPFFPCRDLEVSAWFFPIQVLKEIIIYLRTSSHLVIERRGKEERESSGGERPRPTSWPYERPCCRIELVRWRPGQAGYAYGSDELDRPSDDLSKCSFEPSIDLESNGFLNRSRPSTLPLPLHPSLSPLSMQNKGSAGFEPAISALPSNRWATA
jgi:hypothetical protein